MSIVLEAGLNPLNAELHPKQIIEGQTLWGTVMDARGVGIPSALIEVDGIAPAYSGADGSYEIPNIPKGVYQVTVSAGGYQTKVYDAISVIPGDANADGVINSTDLTKVERIMMGLDPPTPSADTNQDGKINSTDLTLIERIMLGLDTPLTTMRFNSELTPS